MMNAFVEGVRDILPAELRRRRAIYKRIRKVFQNADYREVITPTLESLELYSGIEGVIDKSEMFKVVDKNSLTSFEVITICTKMQCQALLVQGHYYRL